MNIIDWLESMHLADPNLLGIRLCLFVAVVISISKRILAAFSKKLSIIMICIV